MNSPFTVAALLIGIPLLPLVEAGGTEVDQSGDRLSALQINVVDLNRAVEFYSGSLELKILSQTETSQSATLACNEIQLLLTVCDSLTAWNHRRNSRTNLNLYVEDLTAYREKLKKDGVRMLDDGMLKAGVGSYFRIADPSGNEIHIMELSYEHDPVTKPTFYNMGTQTTNMAASRSFYEKLLGFEVLSEKYYPPVIPYKVRGAQLILHNGAELPSAARTVNSSRMIPILVCGNLSEQLKKLGGIKTELVKAPPLAGTTGECRAVRDPDGNLIFLMQRGDTLNN